MHDFHWTMQAGPGGKDHAKQTEINADISRIGSRKFAHPCAPPFFFGI
jgi:hypothetical protein